MKIYGSLTYHAHTYSDATQCLHPTHWALSSWRPATAAAYTYLARVYSFRCESSSHRRLMSHIFPTADAAAAAATIHTRHCDSLHAEWEKESFQIAFSSFYSPCRQEISSQMLFAAVWWWNMLVDWKLMSFGRIRLILILLLLSGWEEKSGEKFATFAENYCWPQWESEWVVSGVEKAPWNGWMSEQVECEGFAVEEESSLKASRKDSR